MENVKQYGRLRSCNEIISYIKISLSRLKKKQDQKIYGQKTLTLTRRHTKLKIKIKNFLSNLNQNKTGIKILLSLKWNLRKIF